MHLFMVYGEASPRADMAANTPSEFRQSDNGLSVHKKSGVVELPGGISPAEDTENELTLRAIRRDSRQTYIEEVGDIGSIKFDEYHGRLLNMLLANRETGGLRVQDLLEKGFLVRGNPGLPTLDDSVQAEILAKQAAMRLNQAFDKSIIATAEHQGKLRRMNLAPYVRFEDPIQFEVNPPSPAAVKLLQDIATPTVVEAPDTADTIDIDRPGESEVDVEIDAALLDTVRERKPLYKIELPDDPTPADALTSVLTTKLPLTHRQREVLALANSVDPDVFGGVMLSNGKSYVEALRIQSSSPNISTANLLGVSDLEFETILKDTLATVRSISAQAAELLEQTIYLSR